MKSTLQWGLIGTFICLALFVFVPSCNVLSENTVSRFAPPKAPEPPPSDKLDEKSVKAYTEKVAAYKDAVTAYISQMQVAGKSDRIATYQLVVTDTLVKYFGATLASLIAFAFVSGGIQMLDNRNRMRSNRRPVDISFFNLPGPRRSGDHDDQSEAADRK